MRQKIFIIFTDLHLAYSPTTLNLKGELERYFEVEILTFESSSYFHKLNDKFVIYLDVKKEIGFAIRSVIRIVCFLFFRNLIFYEVLRKVALAKYLYKQKYHRIIAVDLKALWYTKGIVKTNVDLLSLELNNHSNLLLKSVENTKVENLIIQNKSRLDFHEHKKHKNVYFIQNAPPYFECIEKASLGKVFDNTLVFSGTAVSQFGIFSCINYLKHNKNYSLTIMGAVSPSTLDSIITNATSLLHSKRIVIRNEYLNEEDYCKELSKFGIGFCFYDFFHPEIQKRYENYCLAPSGKMFKYLAAGVPVIGIDIPGLEIVKNYNAGVLIKEITDESINTAIDEIAANYPVYLKNCFSAARDYDFRKMASDYIRAIGMAGNGNSQ